MRQLAERGLTLASVEAGTRGQLAGRLANAENSREVFLGGRVLPEPERLCRGSGQRAARRVGSNTGVGSLCRGSRRSQAQHRRRARHAGRRPDDGARL